MIDQSLSLPILLQQLSDDVVLGEALFFPEFSRLGDSGPRVIEAIASDVNRWLDDLPCERRGELYRRWSSATLQLLECRVPVQSPLNGTAWRTPVEMEWQAVWWTQRDHSVAAYIPELEIEVLADSELALEDQCRREVQAALQRMRKTATLLDLAMVQRSKSLSLSVKMLQVKWGSLKNTVRQEEQAEKKETTVLEDVAVLVRHQWPRPAYHYEIFVQQLVEALSASRPASVLLVGPSGVGKTAVVGELTRRQASTPLAQRTIWSTDGSRLIAGMLGFGMWQQRCQELCRECARQQAILHVGSLVELMEVGRSEGQSQGIASFLRPYIARGDLLVIAECTVEQVSWIERTAPQLLAAFQRVDVSEPSPTTELRILQSVLDDRKQTDTTLEIDAVQQLADLHHRYATYSASPGRPLTFLNNLLADQGRSGDGRRLTPQHVTKAFSTETGLPLAMLEPTEPLDYEAALTWFSERVIGQAAAVKAVVDVLMRLKATLNRTSRPLASLLMVGPTGVGKTELAKTLARFVFGSRERLIRIDMSEYADGLGVQRLIGGLHQSDGVLTSRVREQPFSVVLLDEFEKAHPLFFDLLLQVLGDGRLTDGRGRLADFRNCIIIMTSNLGSKDFGVQHVGFEGQASTRGVETHFLRAVEEFLRPELYNRMDRVIPFQPLDDETARSIIRREIELMQQRDGIRFRAVALEIDPGVVEHLRVHGFERQYGARSLKRVLEREILIPLSRELNRFATQRAVQIHVSVTDGSIQLRAESQDHVAQQVEQRSEFRLLQKAQQLRRYWQALNTCSALQEMRDRLFRLERKEHKLLRRKRLREEDLVAMETRRRLSERIQSVQLSGENLVAFEDDRMLKLCLQQSSQPPASVSIEEDARSINAWEQDVKRAAMIVHAATISESDEMQLFIYGESRSTISRLAALYLDITERLAGDSTIWAYSAGDPKQEFEEERWSLDEMEWISGVTPTQWRSEFDQSYWLGIATRPSEKQLWRARARRPRALVANPLPKGTLGLHLQLRAEMVRPRLVDEFGIHEFAVNENKTRCQVLTSCAPVTKFLPPWRFYREQFDARTIRRKYLAKTVDDVLMKTKAAIGRENFLDVLDRLIFLRHQQEAEKVAYQ